MREARRRTSVARSCAAGALALVLALGGVPVAPALADDGIESAETPAASAADPAEQLELQGASEGTAVTSTDTAWTTGTYTVTGEITNVNRIVCTGAVTLVLNEGSKLIVPSGITVSEGNTLTIQGTGELVADLSALSSGTENCAAIGGDDSNGSAGTVNIEGGTVTATGGTGGAGIGGAYGGGGTVTITGGTVTATGGTGGAGIGGGGSYDGCGNGGAVTITGGTVTATGGNVAAGIGCGASAVKGATVTITGGTVTARGGDYTSNAEGQTESPGAGIGAGGAYDGNAETPIGCDSGTVTIGGDAVVKATGGLDLGDSNSYGPAVGIGLGAAAAKAGTTHGTLAIGTGRRLYSSAEALGIDVKDAEYCRSGATASYEGERHQYMVVNGNEEHLFTYSASGAENAGTTITATCSIADCSLENHRVVLTIKAPQHYTVGDGRDPCATLDGLTAFNQATGLDVRSSDIKYATMSGEELVTAPTDEGSYVASITAGGVTAQVAYSIANVEPEPEPDGKPSYALSDVSNADTGGAAIWTKESSEGLTFTFKRSVDDDKTYEAYVSAKVDAVEVPAWAVVTARGSLILTLSPAYLQTLADGNHTLTVTFKDGEASAPFTVNAATSGGSSGSKATAARTASSRGLPKTGDLSLAAPIAACASLAVVALAASFALRRRRR